MRAGIGLLVLLITVCIMLLLYVGLPGVGGKGYLQTVRDQGQKSTAFANQLGGKDPTGNVAFVDSLQLRKTDGKYFINWLKPGGKGPAEMRFGLKVDDQIVRVGPFDARDGFQMGDKDAVLGQMREAYTRDWTIVVLRDGQTIELPTPEQRDRTKHEMPSMTNPFGVPSR